MTEQMSFTELCTKQPAIMDLHRRVKGRRGAKDWHTWEAYKAEIAHLVGWGASSTDTAICSPQAYNIVYQACFDKWDHTGGV